LLREGVTGAQIFSSLRSGLWLGLCSSRRRDQGSHASWKVLDSFLENSRTWKLKLEVLESPGKISLKVMHFLVVQMENKQQ